MINFTKSNRAKIIEQCKEDLFDILIVGGGITGAGIALDAVSRGLSVLLVEKVDFAEGTSSKSTKLVHGGLRYLKNLEFKLVKDAGRERAVLYQNAPHIVYPQEMILPIYKENKYGKLLTSFALWIYDSLAGVEPKYKKKNLSRIQLIKKIPLLKEDGLKGGISYYEYRTKDSRLVIENIKKANELGAVALNYVELIQIETQKDKTVSAKLFDKISQQEIRCKSKVIVNATGAWADEILNKNQISNKKLIFPSKGIHIVFDKVNFPIHKSIYIEIDDGRMIFAIPSGNKVYVGTSDDEYKGNLDNPFAIEQEVDYLLNAINHYLKKNLSKDKIEISWAGIRPLINKNSKKIDSISRKEEIIVHNKNVVSVLGGKLTAYRLMAENAIDKILPLLGKQVKNSPSQTKEIPLAGAEFGFGKIEVHKLVAYEETLFYQAYQLNATTELIHNLFNTYGKNLEIIIERAFDIYNKIENRTLVWLEAEIWYVVNFEMLLSLSDFMIRRTDRFFLQQKESTKELDDIMKILSRELNLSENETKEQFVTYKAFVEKNSMAFSSQEISN